MKDQISWRWDGFLSVIYIPGCPSGAIWGQDLRSSSLSSTPHYLKDFSECTSLMTYLYTILVSWSASRELTSRQRVLTALLKRNKHLDRRQGTLSTSQAIINFLTVFYFPPGHCNNTHTHTHTKGAHWAHEKCEDSPHWCDFVGWAWSCKPKGCWFDSQSGHMSGWQAMSSVGGVQEATNRCFSHN